MGIDSRNAPPLPAPTEESESTVTQTELATSEASKPADDKSSYSLPEDGTPVTIKTRGHKPDRSQTSLLIEYFEGGKASPSPSTTGDRRPSVRVRLTPSKNRKTNHIQITETKSSSGRKASLTRRQERASPLTPTPLNHVDALSVLSGDREDANSMHSYTSATEESNVSRNPIEVDIDRSSHNRRRRPASPLIPPTESKVSYQGSNLSDISAIPTDSFLDGSAGSTLEEKRSKSPSRSRDVIGGAAAGLATAAAADRLRRKSRSELSEKERSLLSKSRERDRSERRHKSKHRKSSGSSDHNSETGKSSRKRSNRGNEESILSGADSSVISSAISHSHRSMDASSMRSGASRSSINNPKLLETVEDAIRRLILPELSAIKREQSKRESRQASLSSTTGSRDDLANDRRQSGYSSKSRENLARGKDRRDREARHELIESPAPSVDPDSVDESLHEIEAVPRSNDKMQATTPGAAVGTTATAPKENSPAIAREQRRRRRAEAKTRANEIYGEDKEEHSAPAPPMPLLSEINTSEVTRTSILTADTDRPHSASEELTPIQQVARGTPSIDSSAGTSPTPTRESAGLQALGAQHMNISHGDLKTLSQKRTGGLEGDYEEKDYGLRAPIRPEEVYDDDEDDEGAYNDYYNTQDVPPPLKYVPYQPERRGLSPIPSVSGITEGGSEIHNRDSRLTHRTSDSFSSPDKSARREDSPSLLSRGSYQDDHSPQSSRLDYRNTTYTDDSELDRVTAGQAMRTVGANPGLVNSPHGVDSHVASLVEGSGLDDSVLTGESGQSGRQRGSRASEQTSEGEAAPKSGARHEQSFESHRTAEEEATTPASRRPNSSRSQHFEEYDLDDYGRKVPRSKYRQSPTASEAAITGAAVGAAAAALKAAAKGKQPYVEEESESGSETDGAQHNKSFKDRTKEGFLPANTPSHSVDRLIAEFEKPRVGHSGLPDPNDPLPEVGFYGHGDDSRTTLSRLSDQLSDTRDHWEEQGRSTPTQESVLGRRELHEQDSAHHPGHDEGGAHFHSRQSSQDVDEEWHRTSEDRKRDTIVTNPYEGTSPLANAPGLDIDLGQAPQFDPHGYVAGYGALSPFGPKVDEGYISQGPNRTPDYQGKGMGIDYSQQPLMSGAMDPFYNSQDPKHMSGLTEGMGSPMYEAATGVGIDSIESKDIIALMQHLMVRDAQRSARDTEILVTLVRTAAEMRNSFDDIKKMLAETEDVVITEVKDNTDKTVQRAIGGPRPFPGSGARSIQGSTDNEKKTRNLWRRALKGLGNKGTSDLTRIEDMLMQLLSEVDVLKEQTAHGGTGQDSGPSLDNIQPAVQYEQDRGYEPEGHAGTSSASYASYASQSGHLSIPRNASGYERKVSGHRISTVPEGDEEDYHDDPNIVIHNHSTTDMHAASQEPERGNSAPRGASPQVQAGAQASQSNENTPRTDKGRKHKSGGSSSWFPKISRWSETTASSVGKAFRKSKDAESSLRGAPSRSGSDLAAYDDYPVSETYLEDFLHSGLSENSLPQSQNQDPNQNDNMQFTLAGINRTPVPSTSSPVQTQAQSHFPVTEDPKYKAHRNSVNLQHPQPRPGQTEHYRTTLENSAQEYDVPMSPKSADFGSVTSLSRFTGHQPTFSNGSATGDEQYTWGGRASPAPSGPPRPPKEPLEDPVPKTTTPTRSRISTLAYKPSGSPKPENRNLQGVLAVPGRRPSGPRAMGSKSPAPPDDERRRRKRDTFGTTASQESDTF